MFDLVVDVGTSRVPARWRGRDARKAAHELLANVKCSAAVHERFTTRARSIAPRSTLQLVRRPFRMLEGRWCCADRRRHASSSDALRVANAVIELLFGRSSRLSTDRRVHRPGEAAAWARLVTARGGRLCVAGPAARRMRGPHGGHDGHGRGDGVGLARGFRNWPDGTSISACSVRWYRRHVLAAGERVRSPAAQGDRAR
jgi:hypothetical protein